jgi:hypothetical protein
LETFDRASTDVGRIAVAGSGTVLAITLAFLGAGVAGCGPPLARVSGTVTFNGEPVSKGTVTLVPADGRGSASGGLIENGRYAIEKVQPGEKIVQLVAPYPMGPQTDDFGSESVLYGDLMPAAWGRASEQKITVVAAGVTKDFAIEGPDPRKKK